MSLFRSSALCALTLSLVAMGCDAVGTANTAEFSGTPAVHANASVAGATVVTATDAQATPWSNFTRDGGAFTFVAGPGTPPSGAGSVQFDSPLSNDKVTLFTAAYYGTPLADLAELAYHTYRVAGSGFQVASLNVELDYNGPASGGFTTLVFEPVYNTSQGTVTTGQWQDWDAVAGGTAVWWSSNPIPAAPNRDTFVPLSAIVAANPDAVIGRIGINQGGGNPGLTTAVDLLTIRDAGEAEATVYDFEQFRTPASRQDCMNGGWQGLTDDQGVPFRNQGQCVSYVSSNRP